MNGRISALFTFCIAACLWPHAAPGGELRWHWEDDFSAPEREKLTEWIGTVTAGIESFIAPYPFRVDIHFHRTGTLRSPVPSANTVRYRRQGVNIFVNPAFSRAELLADWTAWHEMSHLLLPYLGQQHAWFAEGFASYMQYQAMHAAGEMSREDMHARYASRIRRAASKYDLPDRTFLEAAPVLRARREYPTMYWAGAAFFLAIDAELAVLGQALPDVVREFVRCCRRDRHSFDSLVESLDAIVGDDVFRRHLTEIQTQLGFPDVVELLEELDRLNS